MANLPKAKIWTNSQTMSSQNYDINLYRDKDFQTVNLHSHDFFELYYFINGNASYIIENGHYTLQPDDILLISPQNLHQLDINDSRKTYERIVLWINPKYLKKISTQKTNLAKCFEICVKRNDYLLREPTVAEKIKSLLSTLYTLRNEHHFGVDVHSENIIKEILLLLCRYQIESDLTPANIAKKRKINPTIEKVLMYVDEHISDDLSLDTIANNIFLSKYYLSRLFKKETNSSLHQYILKKRLILSKKLIEKNMPIIEVYIRCGFTDYSHFFRAFKAEYGITPKQYYASVVM